MEEAENTTHLTDRKSLTILEPWEYQYYTMNFGCSEDELKSALRQVGNSPENLQRYLKIIER